MRTVILVFLTVALAGCTSMLLGTGGASAGRPVGSDSRSASDAADDARISAIIRNRFAGDDELAAAKLQVVTVRRVVARFRNSSSAIGPFGWRGMWRA